MFGENAHIIKFLIKCNNGLLSPYGFPVAEVAEELCKTSSQGTSHSFSHDQPLLPSKVSSRTLRKHAENKENIEGGLDGRGDSEGGGGGLGPAGTPSRARRLKRLRRMGRIFLSD